MKEGTIKLTWRCKTCKDVKTSYSTIRHNMNFCKCGDSGVDLEEYYQRTMGSVEDLSREKLVNNKWEKL